ncbi:MAG: 3-deoxy-manno-octulosonate cytidylyltransferase [Thermodesulfobacteriota bacterium]|nr:3-deoxy-manno-octulosonate cytidylyltransferase [Thermodesulfobacteriota bacterium]
MKVYVIIPSRYGSTRFKGKPLALIAGRPMIRHVFERAGAADGVDRVIVATDDERIRDAVHAFGGEAIMTGKNHPSGTDRLAEAVERLGLSPEDIVVNVQGDQPAFDPKLVSDVVRPLVEDQGLEMSTPIIHTTDLHEINDPNHVKVVFDQDRLALYFSRAPIPWPREGDESYYFKHIGIYGYRVSFLRRFVTLPPGPLENLEKLEQLRALEHGFRIKVVLTDLDSPEVDTPEDVPKAEAFLQRAKEPA